MTYVDKIKDPKIREIDTRCYIYNIRAEIYTKTAPFNSFLSKLLLMADVSDLSVDPEQTTILQSSLPHANIKFCWNNSGESLN